MRKTQRPAGQGGSKLESKNSSQLSPSSKSNLECKFLNSCGQPDQRGRS
jgi:hypothetical protein